MTLCCNINRLYYPSGPGLPGSPPTLIHQHQVILTYPYGSPSITLSIRTPEFGNTLNEHKNRVYREVRNGSIKEYRDSIWPKHKRLKYNFIALKQNDIDTLFDFIYQSLADYIGLLDYENRQWKVILLNPDTAISEKYSVCGFSVGLEMQGELV